MTATVGVNLQDVKMSDRSQENLPFIVVLLGFKVFLAFIRQRENGDWRQTVR